MESKDGIADDFRRGLQSRGAVWSEYRGIAVPAHFGDAAREWRAAREAAGVAVALRTLTEARGDDRVAFLQGMLTNDVKALTAGRGVYAALLTQQGRVVSDLRVYADADRLLLDAVAWQAAAARMHLERFLVADDVELEQPADEQPLLSLEGPLAGAIAAEALGVPALPRQPLEHVRLTFQSRPVRAILASDCDGPGVLLCGPAAVAAGLFDACCEAGARPLGMTALDTLRVESGVPWSGVDMDESVLLQETGREAAISFTKGCYLGQEVIERVAARGHVNRHLAGLRCAGDQVPAARTPVLADGHEVGYVTSGARAGTAGRAIALAMINRKYIEPGQQLVLGSGASAIAAVVSRLPFDLAEIE